LAALARGFSDRHFQRGEGPGDEVGTSFRPFGTCAYFPALGTSNVPAFDTHGCLFSRELGTGYVCFSSSSVWFITLFVFAVIGGAVFFCFIAMLGKSLDVSELHSLTIMGKNLKSSFFQEVVLIEKNEQHKNTHHTKEFISL